MATKPLLTNTSAFDATVGTTFTFGWKGAQAFYNELVIKDSETLAVVYSYKIKTMALRHVMDIANGVVGNFVNGRQYQATVSVYDKDNTLCGTSDPVIFWCYSSPTLSVTNSDILSGKVTMSSVYVTLEYVQTEGEPLKEYAVFIYDGGKNLLSQSSVITVDNAADSMIYKLEGLTNSAAYNIKIDGVTYHGISVSTGYVPFTVVYDRMGVGAVLVAKNIGDGTISISSNFRITNAETGPGEIVYVDGTEVDLTGDGAYVEFVGGVDIGHNFELKTRIRDVNEGEIISLNGSNGSIVISYGSYYTDAEMTVRKYYFKLETTGAVKYTAFSKLFSAPTADQYIKLLIVSENGYYSIKAQTE